MRKLLCFAILATSAVANAVVIPVPLFPTPATHIEDFDAMAPGSFFAVNMFAFPPFSTAYVLSGSGTLDVGPPAFWQPPALSAPHTMLANGDNVGIRVSPPQRRFGGFFRNTVNSAGVSATAIRFVFYDQFNTVIGVQPGTLTNTWQWFGFMTQPQLFTRVEIYTNIGGDFEMDNLRIRWF